MRDIVDAMRLLIEPQRVTTEQRRFAKFSMLWQTAEASGCVHGEIELRMCGTVLTLFSIQCSLLLLPS